MLVILYELKNALPPPFVSSKTILIIYYVLYSNVRDTW